MIPFHMRPSTHFISYKNTVFWAWGSVFLTFFEILNIFLIFLADLSQYSYKLYSYIVIGLAGSTKTHPIWHGSIIT